MPRYTDEDAARWYARYQEGLTLAEVAKEVGVPAPTVQGAFLRRGWERRPAMRRTALARPRRPRPELPATRPAGLSDREWRVLAARREGLSLAEIGEELGVSRQRVAQIEARALARSAGPEGGGAG